MQSSEELTKIVDDVSYIISSKLKDALIPVIQKQSSTESTILNLPFVQKIVNENRALKIKNAELETKIAVVRENYKRLFLSKVSSEATNSNENNIEFRNRKEYNVSKVDYDSISKIEEEIIELNKEEFESLDESNDDFDGMESESSDEAESDQLQEIMKAIPNYVKKQLKIINYFIRCKILLV